MEKTVVYVFGPKRLHSDYIDRKPVEWVKIGQTKVGDDDIRSKKDKFQIAMDRVAGESKTGIPETCKMYDVFEFPSDGKVDDKVRKKLSEKLYQNIQTSMDNNKLVGLIDQYEIKAGQEFVYNVTRDMIFNAVESYMYEVISRELANWVQHGDCLLNEIYEVFRGNTVYNYDADPDQVENNSTAEAYYSSFWNKLSKKTTVPFANNGRRYVILKSEHAGCLYSVGIGLRESLLSVTFESFARERKGGDFVKGCSSESDLRDKIQSAIDCNTSSLPSKYQLKGPFQGKKRSDKWFWSIQCAFDENDEEKNIQWFVDSITDMRDYFEKLSV